jgi:hypothetical protein
MTTQRIEIHNDCPINSFQNMLALYENKNSHPVNKRKFITFVEEYAWENILPCVRECKMGRGKRIIQIN